MKFDSNMFGLVDKIRFIKYLYGRVAYEFERDQYCPNTAFAKAYGIQGVYFSDLDEEIMTSPLVLIQQKDLAELVAAKIIADQHAYSDEYCEENIKQKSKEITRSYLIESGMSEQDIDFYEDLRSEGK